MELAATKRYKLLEHCGVVFEAMKQRAEPNDDGDLLYTGHLTHMFDEIGYSAPQYSDIMDALKRMDCVERIRRGSRNFPAIWKILREPTQELFEFMPEKPKTLTAQARATLEQKVDMMEERLKLLEDTVLPVAHAEIENAIREQHGT